MSRENWIKLINCELVKLVPENSLWFKDLLVQNIAKPESDGATAGPAYLPEAAIMFSPQPVSELEAAVVKIQKVYKSYRTRRNLADRAVVVEELWWKAISDFTALKRSSVHIQSSSDVVKGLSTQHWLEAIDPRHRCSHNLRIYYDEWIENECGQPFFYWLDVGDGKEINLEKCSRANLQRQCIKYLGANGRESYEVVVENGKLVYKQSGTFVHTKEGSKWIFVLSTKRRLYVGQKKKGSFRHSSFLAGGAITAAGRLAAHEGVLEAIWPYSGQYRPTEENFREFISFLEEQSVDLANVKCCASDEGWMLGTGKNRSREVPEGQSAASMHQID